MTLTLSEEYTAWAVGAKIELVEGQLIVGKSRTHSRLLLQHILQGWSAQAAVALAPSHQWWEALSIAFGAPPCSPIADLDRSTLQAWADATAFVPALPSALTTWNWRRVELQQHLSIALFTLMQHHSLGQTSGRGVVNRFDNNGLMPEIFCFWGQPDRLYEYYLDGAPELIVEFLVPGVEEYDRHLKRSCYQSAGVQEYWMVDTAGETIELLRLVEGEYQHQVPDESGRYAVSSFPGLTFFPDRLWQHNERRSLPFEDWFAVNSTALRCRRVRPHAEGLDERRSLSTFPITLEPVPIAFEDYLYWCPEAKFEFSQGKPDIGGRAGIRGLLGMLLLTFGLVEAVQLCHPRVWVDALLEQRELAVGEPTRRTEGWRVIRQAAALLRERYGVERVAVVGDWASSTPLNVWSEMILVVWRLPHDSTKPPSPEQVVSRLSEPFSIRLIDAEGSVAPLDRHLLGGVMIDV